MARGASVQVIVQENGHELVEFEEDNDVGVKVIVQPRQVVVTIGTGGGTVGGISPTAPPDIGESGSSGNLGLASDGGHTHGHGNLTGGAHHALAASSAAGFAPHLLGTQFAVLMENPVGTPVFAPFKASMLAPDFSASLSGGGTVEVGQPVATPAFTASYVAGPATALTFSDSDGNTPQNVLSTPSAFSSAYSFTKTANNAVVTFTLAAVKGSETSSPTAQYAWRPKVFWGNGAAGLSTEADIEALANSALASSRARTFTLAPGAAQYIYYAIPSSYGTPTFTVGGFEGGFQLVASAVSVTNGYGVAQNYDLWRSTNPNLGSTQVVVS